MRALDDDALQAFDDLQNMCNGPTLPTRIPNMPCPACGGGLYRLKGVLRGPSMVRDSTNTVGNSVGFATNIVASPLAVAPAVDAAAARAIARRLIGIRQF
jgi:hypothetical protein